MALHLKCAHKTLEFCKMRNSLGGCHLGDTGICEYSKALVVMDYGKHIHGKKQWHIHVISMHVDVFIIIFITN